MKIKSRSPRGHKKLEIEEVLLIASIVLLVFDLLLMSRTRNLRVKAILERGLYASVLAFVLLVISYGSFAQMFLSDDFSLIEAFSYSSSSLPFIGKLHATWAGAGGSLLFLTLLIGLVYIILRICVQRKVSVKGINACKFLCIMFLFFLVLTAGKNPFVRFEGTVPEGKGLNPSLQSFWMTIHPPIVFAGYAFVLLGFALSLASMSRSSFGRKYDKLKVISLQFAWLFLTLGIAMGGVWAYEELGWGGYWAWDPVETASLMTWLALTTYFHFGAIANRLKGLTGELMILLTFGALVFLSALTRGGFRQSVHAYALSPAGPILLVFAVVMIGYFIHLKRKAKLPVYLVDVDRSSLYSVSLYVASLSLIAIFVVCFIGVVFPMIANVFTDAPIITGVEFYNYWSFPFVLAFVISLIGCWASKSLSYRFFAVLTLVSLVVGIVFSLIGFPTSNVLANIGLPILTVTLFTTVFGFVNGLLRKGNKFRVIGRKLIHIGVIVTLIGVMISAGGKETTYFESTNPNTTLETMGLTINLGNFTVYHGEGIVYAQDMDMITHEYTSLQLPVEIISGNDAYQSDLWGHLYINYGLKAEPLIISTWTGDIYLHYSFTQSMYDSLFLSFMGNIKSPDSLNLTIERVPMVYLVWVGVIFLSVGIAMTTTEAIIYFNNSKKAANAIKNPKA